MAEKPEEKFSTTVRRTKLSSVVLVPQEVVLDARLSLADLGLYVKLTQRTATDVDLDKLVEDLLAGEFGKRVDVDEAGLRAGVQRLIDAELLAVHTAREKEARDRLDQGRF
ncbi:hypothetical protein OG596_38725 (plasmid) [Streptomyces sp. NBC_01102]|uniref:hypothetical protein n=1 Tax=Streptomyces sp. NBC_01102 TaxID=2903749 RepID=UPI003867A3AC|nr:hypothetical protein OG596_38725 [Streptomyces sp. NBC_01102]